MSELKLDSVSRRAIQRQFAQDHAQPLDEMKRSATLSLTAVNTGKWAKRPRMFDVSDYQPMVDWKLIFDQDPDCAGAIVKIAEPYDNASNGSLECNYWFEETAAKHMTDIYNYTDASNTHKVIGAYIYGNPSRSAALDLTWYKSLDDGTPEEQVAKWMRDDAHFYCAVRALKIGFRKNPTINIGDLIAMANAYYDEICMDWERPFKYYLPKDQIALPSNILSPNVIGEVIRRTNGRFRKAIEWGLFPKTTKLINYSATWFIKQYLTDKLGNQNAFDGVDTWLARYLLFSKKGLMSVAEMAALYKEIPDDFPYEAFGEFKRLQVTGDLLKIPEMRTPLGPCGLDGNIWNGDWANMEAYYGHKILRGVGSIVIPPVVVEPPTPVVKRYYAKVRQTAVGLKLRTTPKVSPDNILNGDFRPTIKFELFGTPIVDGSITWVSLGRAFFASKQGSTIYADITEEVV